MSWSILQNNLAIKCVVEASVAIPTIKDEWNDYQIHLGIFLYNREKWQLMSDDYHYDYNKSFIIVTFIILLSNTTPHTFIFILQP